MLLGASCASGRAEQTDDPFVRQQLAALDSLPLPAGVAPANWSELKATLHAALEQRLADGRRVSTAPSTDFSRTRLSFDYAAGQLNWGFYSAGDYNQDGEVNISDLTPLAVHLGESSQGSGNSIQAVVDGDANGQVTIADLTPIGANLGTRLTEYRVYASQSEADFPASNTAVSTISPLGTLALAAATGNSTDGRKQFAFTVPAPGAGDIYWVRPSDGSAEGTASRMKGPGAPIGSSIELHQLSFQHTDGSVHEHSGWGLVTVRYDRVPETLFFNMEWNGSQVLTNMPLPSLPGNSGRASMALHFNLGVADGTEVTEGVVNYSVDKVLKASSALRRVSDTAQTVPVKQAVDPEVPQGNADENFIADPAGGYDEYGRDISYQPVSYETASHSAFFPDQERGFFEEVPAAVSNSLTYLKGRFNLPIGEGTDKPIDIAIMKDACGKVLGADSGTYIGAPNEWPYHKDLYMQQNDYPITTRVTNSLEEAYAAMQDDCDVELIVDYQQGPGGVSYHWTTALTSITKTDADWAVVTYVDDYYPDSYCDYGLPLLGVLRRDLTEDYEAWDWQGSYGEEHVSFVIECPEDYYWFEEPLWSYSGTIQAACFDEQGNLWIAGNRWFDQKLYISELESHFYVTKYFAILGDQDSSSENSIKLIYDSGFLNLFYSDNNFVTGHKLNYVKFKLADYSYTTSEIDSSVDGSIGTSMDWKVVGGLQLGAYYKSVGIGYDLYTVYETAPGSGTFTAPLKIPAVNTFGQQVKFDVTSDGSTVITWLNGTDLYGLTDYNWATGTYAGFGLIDANVQAFDVDTSDAQFRFWSGKGDGVYGASWMKIPGTWEPSTKKLDTTINGLNHNSFDVVQLDGGVALVYTLKDTLDVTYWQSADAGGTQWSVGPQVIYKMDIDPTFRNFELKGLPDKRPLLIGPDKTGYGLSSWKTTLPPGLQF